MSQVHWLALASVSGVGGVTAHRLLEQFGNVEEIFHASATDLMSIPRVTKDIAAQIAQAPLEAMQEEVYGLSEEEIDVLTWDDPRFPARLRELPDAPIVLFLRGRLVREDELAVAIVGTREARRDGIERATILARELASRGLTIVSGLALGIDTAAHQGALAAEGGRTLAVLGSGIRVIHPRENSELAERISQHGAVLSEFMPNTPPRGPQLMSRDRIVSGLSRAVIVIEAGMKSGSLDTAAKAQKQRRKLFAVRASPGTDALIRTGATALDWDQVDFEKLTEELKSDATSSEQGGSQQLSLL